MSYKTNDVGGLIIVDSRANSN